MLDMRNLNHHGCWKLVIGLSPNHSMLLWVAGPLLLVTDDCLSYG